MRRLLIVVDVQNDFVSGSLGFEGAENLAPRIEKRIHEYLDENDDVVFTRDTHLENYLETQEGKNLPVVHCVKGTWGHEIVQELQKYVSTTFDKPTFGSLELGNWLKHQNYEEIELCGLVSNICVISNAVIAKAALPETKIVVNASLTDSFDKKRHEEALSILEGLQVEVIRA